MSKRYIFIGDIHGCLDELERLLAKAGVSSRDVVVALGDVVAKGPHPDDCAKLIADRGYRAVSGNAEVRLMRSARARLGMLTRRKRQTVAIVREWPYLIDFPFVNVLAVHGGVLPGLSPGQIKATARHVTELRYIRRDGEGWKPVAKNRERVGDRFWADEWDGARVVVYGHTPVRKPRVTAKTVGLDTGCVYGGRLTAAIYDGRDWGFVSVRAKKAYVEKS